MDELTIEKIEKIAGLTREYQDAVRAISECTNVGGLNDQIQIYAFEVGGLDNLAKIFKNAGYLVHTSEYTSDEGCWAFLNAEINGIKFVSCEAWKEVKNDEA